MKRYLAFVRVSSREQQQEGFSLEVQEEKTRAYASRKGIHIEEMFSVAETASEAQARKVFRRMLQIATENADRLDGIVFDRVDRSTRNHEDTANLLLLKYKHGFVFAFASEGFDTTTDQGELMFVVLAGLSTYHTKGNARSIRASQEKRVQSGLFHSYPPYGYLRHSRTQVDVHPENGPKITLIFELYATGTYTLKSLVQALWDRGIPYTDRTPRFNKAKLHQILRDRSYLGEINFRGAWHPGKHEELVDQLTFDRVQTLLRRGVYLHHFLTYSHKLVKCGHCDR